MVFAMTGPLLIILSLFLSFIPSHAQLVLNGGGMGMGMGMGQPQPPTTPDITAPGAPGINTGINLNGLNTAGMGLNGLEGLNSLNSLNTLNGLNTMGGINGLNSLNGLNTLGALNGLNTLGGIPLTNAGLGGLGGNYGTLGGFNGLNTAGLGGAGGYGTLGGFNNGLNTAELGANLANYGGLNGFGTAGLMGSGLAGNNLANFGAINGLNPGGMNGLTTAGLGLGGANTLGGLQTVNVNPYGAVGYGGMQTMGTTATMPMNTAPAATNYDPFATFGSGGNTAPATTYTPVTYPAAYNPVTTAAAAPYTPPATTTTTYVQPATQAAAAPQTITLPTRVINLPAQTAATSPTSATSNINDGYGTMLSKLEVPDPSDATTTTRRSRPAASTHTSRPRQRSRSRGRPRARPHTRAPTPATTEQNVNAITDTTNPTSEQLSSIMHQLRTLQQVQIQQAQAQQIQAQQAHDQQTQLQQHLQVAQQRQQQIEALVQAQATAQAQSAAQAQTRAQVQAQEPAQVQASVSSIRDQPQPHPEANPNCPALTFTSKMLLVQPGTNANGGSIYKLTFTTTSPSSANWVDVHLMKNPTENALQISADSTPTWEVNMRMTPVPSSLLSTSRIDSIPSEHPPQQRHLLAINDPSYTAFEVYLPTVPMKDDDTLAYMLTYGTIKEEKEIACDSEIQIFAPSNTAPPTHLIQQTSQIQPALQSTSHKTSQQTSPIQPTSQVQPTHHRSHAVTSNSNDVSQHPIHDEISSILGTSSTPTPACPSITYTPTFNLLVTPSTSNEDTERYYSIVFKGTRGKKINWVDVHVGINTSSHSDSWAQSNFRLIATSPTTFEHTLPVPISNGDSITYQFTYSAGGVQCDSEVHTMSSTELLQAASVTAG